MFSPRVNRPYATTVSYVAAALAMGLCFGACGTDDSDRPENEGADLTGACGINEAQVTGSVAGHSLSEVKMAHHGTAGSHHVVVLDEEARTCQTEGFGDRLRLTLCGRAEGTYTVVPAASLDCAATPFGASAAFVTGSGQLIAAAASGTVTLSSVDSSCEEGQFELSLVRGSAAAASMSGSFASQALCTESYWGASSN